LEAKQPNSSIIKTHMNSTAKILIIIVTWNKKDYVIDLLESLSSITFPKDQATGSNKPSRTALK
jgi:hypothetical protein